jgi:hypothetical protein
MKILKNLTVMVCTDHVVNVIQIPEAEVPQYKKIIILQVYDVNFFSQDKVHCFHCIPAAFFIHGYKILTPQLIMCHILPAVNVRVTLKHDSPYLHVSVDVGSTGNILSKIQDPVQIHVQC